MKLEDQEIFGSVTISFELINRRIVYKDTFDNLYEVILQDTFDVQIMQKIDGCYPLKLRLYQLISQVTMSVKTLTIVY